MTQPPVGAAAPASGELFRRIVSGVVMAVAALGLTTAGGAWFATLVAAGAAIMCWEWGRLVRGVTPSGGAQDGLLILHAGSAIGITALTLLGYPGWAGAVLAGAMVALYALDSGRLLSAVGAAYVGIPALVLVWLRQEPDYGLTAVLYLFMAVWVTDIGAYAAGRTLGGPKLAPRISPGKTWSGLLGGVALSGLTGAAFGAYVSGASATRLGLLAVVLAVSAQIGDLYESALKRRSGLKDASNLIPGHGGLLDRVDGLVAAVALVTLIVLVRHAEAPARGLLLGQ